MQPVSERTLSNDARGVGVVGRRSEGTYIVCVADATSLATSYVPSTAHLNLEPAKGTNLDLLKLMCAYVAAAAAASIVLVYITIYKISV